MFFYYFSESRPSLQGFDLKFLFSVIGILDIFLRQGGAQKQHVGIGKEGKLSLLQNRVKNPFLIKQL